MSNVSFIVHYIVRTPVKDLNFDIVSHDPCSDDMITSLRESLARDASIKTGNDITSDDIVIANIIPIPRQSHVA